tara:strand:+ start:2014 stop:2760 length:747 start_codon:yes stop_codon:yes gene_type:complete
VALVGVKDLRCRFLRCEKGINGTADFTIRNIVTVSVFGGMVAGFIVAMLLNVFEADGKDSTTDWIMTVAAVSSSLISGLAVILVAQTLSATRETLQATQVMAEYQRRIGDTQTRPWLLMESCFVDNFNDSFSVCINLRNYGTTPAAYVRIGGLVEEWIFEEDGYGNVQRSVIPKLGLRSIHLTAIAPSSTYTARFNIDFNEYDFKQMPPIKIDWSYMSHDRKISDDRDVYIHLTLGEDDTVQFLSANV